MKLNMREKDKKILPLLWLALAALLIELLPCNFSAWKSLFYRDRIVFENVGVEGGEATGSAGEYMVWDGMLTLKIPEVDMEIHNLFFALDFSESEVIPYTVTVTDEGNYYPYTLPEGVIAPGVEKSYYTNIYPSGRVGEITLQFTVPEGSAVTVSGVCANARIPFQVSPGRFTLLFSVLLLGYYIGGNRIKNRECVMDRKQTVATAAVIILLIGMGFMLAHVNPICVTSPWPHHKQYQELAEAMSQGYFYLDTEPSEGLLQAPNPYDTIYLQAQGIDYRADYAYRDGKYYVYFGVVPELLLYLPCYLLTGHHMPNYMAVFIFYSGFILAVFALFREVVKRWFRTTPYAVYLLVSVLTVCCGNYLFVIARPDLYNVPIMAATMFTVAGLWLWIKGKYADTVRKRRICYFAGSLSMALVAGCRPQMLLFSFLAVPLFWDEVIRKRELFGKKNSSDTVCICLPYLAVAAGVMYYNAARFGSVFDFGATYSLTSNDMTKRGFNMEQMLLGLWHYFLRPAVVESDFPFLRGVQIESSSYFGKLNAEYTYGGILAVNAFTWIILFAGKARKALKEKGLYALVLISMGISVVLGIVDVTGAGILQRYMVDMIWGIWFASALLLLLAVERMKDTEHYGTVLKLLTAVCILQAAFAFGIVMGNGDLSVNVRTSNPALYYHIRSLFLF